MRARAYVMSWSYQPVDLSTTPSTSEASRSVRVTTKRVTGVKDQGGGHYPQSGRAHQLITDQQEQHI